MRNVPRDYPTLWIPPGDNCQVENVLFRYRNQYLLTVHVFTFWHSHDNAMDKLQYLYGIMTYLLFQKIFWPEWKIRPLPSRWRPLKKKVVTCIFKMLTIQYARGTPWLPNLMENIRNIWQ